MKGFAQNILPLSALFVSTTAAYAAFDGFYFGINAGAVQTQTEITDSAQAIHQYPPASHFNTISTQSSSPVYDQSMLVSGHIGYGYQFQSRPLYIGAEIFISGFDTEPASHSSAVTSFPQASDTYLSSHNRAELNDTEYGVDLKGGVVIDPRTLIYGRVGAALNEMKLTSDYQIDTTDDFVDSSASNSFSQSKEDDVTALRLGVGIERYISRHFALTADYIYTLYDNIETTIADDTTNVDGSYQPNGFTSHAKAEFESQAVLLGVNYYFSGNNKAKYKMNYDAARSRFNSAILGVRAGALQHNAEVDSATELDIPTIFNNTLNIDDDFYANGSVGGVFAGYGSLFNNSLIYLGVEFFFNEIINTEIKAEASDTYSERLAVDSQTQEALMHSTVKAELGSEFGIDARPGILLSDNILLYGRIGVAANEVELSSHNQFYSYANGVLDTSGELTAHPEDSDEDVTGLRLGFGLEYYMRDKFSITADYIYTNYGSVNAQGAELVNDDQAVFSTDTEVDIATQTVMLGVIYHHF